MYIGKILFAQLMEFLPWKTFHQIVDRYGGDRRTRCLSCAAQFRVMAFAQLTYRESLRDIEVCLAAQAGKLYHMGIGEAVARSTLADANESRDWRIYFDLAQRLIVKARDLRRRGLRRDAAAVKPAAAASKLAGADLLLHVRCAVYNGALGSGLGQLFEPVSRPG